MAPNYYLSNDLLGVQLINDGEQRVNIPLTAFYNIRVANLTPQVGWTFAYNVNTDLVNVNTTGSGTVTQSDSKGVLQTGAATSSSAQISTRKVARYVPGLGLFAMFTVVFTEGVSGSQQLIGIGDSKDGLFFGYNGSDFSILRRQDGSDYWIPQTAWNGDKLDGTGLSEMTLDTTKGNIYGINFQWLGFGLIKFLVSNPDTGDMITVHEIKYANTSQKPHIFNPNLPLTALVQNTTNITNITLQTPCGIVHLEGDFDLATTTQNAISNSTVIPVSTETNILTIRSKPAINANNNRVPVQLIFISSFVEVNATARFRFVRNGTLSTPSYTDINATNSVIQYDTTGTYTSGTGSFILDYQVRRNDSRSLIVDSMQIFIEPGETLTVTATSSQTGEVGASLNWHEFY